MAYKSLIEWLSGLESDRIRKYLGERQKSVRPRATYPDS